VQEVGTVGRKGRQGEEGKEKGEEREGKEEEKLGEKGKWKKKGLSKLIWDRMEEGDRQNKFKKTPIYIFQIFLEMEMEKNVFPLSSVSVLATLLYLQFRC
jgi:hypothetical protein